MFTENVKEELKSTQEFDLKASGHHDDRVDPSLALGPGSDPINLPHADYISAQAEQEKLAKKKEKKKKRVFVPTKQSLLYSSRQQNTVKAPDTTEAKPQPQKV